MHSNSEAWLKRARDVISGRCPPAEVIQSAVSLLTTVYGQQSSQLGTLTNGLAQASKSAPSGLAALSHQERLADGAIRNTIAEIENGLINSLRARVAGEVFSELVELGKETLQDGTDAAKNVSAVLIAAAFEDLMRRMGSELAGVIGRPKLEDVLIALNRAGVTQGSEVGTAQSFLKFRNDSLHADWSRVTRVQVESCTAFVDAMLVKHFS